MQKLQQISASQLPKKLLLIGAIAAIYYITAKLGQLLAIPPGFVTPVYPPSGIALVFFYSLVQKYG